MLSRPDGPMLSAMMDEMVLRRPVGGSGCMSGQLQHLFNMASRPRVEILVAPFGVGADPGPEGPMMIMEFDAQPTPRELRSMALSPEDSVRLIADIAGETT